MNDLMTFFDTLPTRYLLRKLDPSDGIKPLDFGGFGINGSITHEGRIIAINTYHPEHGYITLTSAPPFDEDKRYDPAAVRTYRKSLAEQYGFGFAFESPIVKREAFLIEDAIPYLRLTLQNGVVAQCVTITQSPSLVVQYWAVSDPDITVNITGTAWFTRCMYTQLTEGGTLPMPDFHVTTHAGDSGHTMIISDSLGTSVISAYMQATADERGELTFGGTYNHNVRRIGVSFQSEAILAKHNIAPVEMDDWQACWRNFPLSDDHPLDLIVRRALVYGLNCCIPVDETICVITDHMLLPLSWNRDAYYVIRALLAWRGQERVVHPIVHKHLLWMFERAERIDGAWGRSYLTTGKVKDTGYQLDQQIYPLLELTDYLEKTGDDSALADFQRHIQSVIDVLMRHKHPDFWLFPTDETPGDDPIAYPYHLSSHILLWHTFNRLSRLDTDIDFAPMIDGIRAGIDAYFIAPHDGKRLYAYATDGAGKHHFYHDANDVPLVLAPVWGMVTADDAVWRDTMDFAFSEANVGGFYDYALGSVHTPAPWSLGDGQEWLYARLIGDEEREKVVIKRLRQASRWDGALPEAYNKEHYSVESRTWFAWPPAMVAWFALELIL